MQRMQRMQGPSGCGDAGLQGCRDAADAGPGKHEGRPELVAGDFYGAGVDRLVGRFWHEARDVAGE